MLRIASIILAVSASISSFAQHTNSIELRLGPEHSMRQDLLLSPFVHTGVSFANVALRWEHSRKMQHFIQLHFVQHNHTFGDPYTFYDNDSSSYVTIPNYWTMVDVDYAIGVNLKQEQTAGEMPDKTTRPVQLTVGGIFTNNVNATPLSTGNFTTFGYFANFSLGGWIWASRPMLGGTCSAYLVLPLLGLTARSPYLLNDDAFIENTVSHNGFITFFEYLGDGRLNTLNRLFNPSLNAHFAKALSTHWSFTVNYEFEWIRHTRPLALTSFRNSLMIGVAFLYGRQKERG